MVTICVIDDDNSLRTALKRILIFRGFHVIDYPSGDDYLEALGSNRIDLVISDIDMPGTNGLEMTKRLRDQGDNTPIIIISGQPGQFKPSALAVGATGFLSKPLDLNELFLLIDDLI